MGGEVGRWEGVKGVATFALRGGRGCSDVSVSTGMAPCVTAEWRLLVALTW